MLRKDELLDDGTPDYVRLILRSSVYDVIDESPITHGFGLSARLGTTVRTQERGPFTCLFLQVTWCLQHGSQTW